MTTSETALSSIAEPEPRPPLSPTDRRGRAVQTGQPPWPPPRSLFVRLRAALPGLRHAYQEAVRALEELRARGVRGPIRRQAHIRVQEVKKDMAGIERAVEGLQKLHEDLQAGRPICEHWAKTYDSSQCTCPGGRRTQYGGNGSEHP